MFLSTARRSYVVISFSISFLDHEVYNLVEKPVGDSLFITQPAADRTVSRTLKATFDCDEVPRLLPNSNHTCLAVFFERSQIMKLFDMSLGEEVTLTFKEEVTNITSFVWSFIPTKYATIENKLLYITVVLIIVYNVIGYGDSKQSPSVDPW